MRHSTSERSWRPAKMRVSLVHSTINSHVTWIILESRGSSVIRTGLLGNVLTRHEVELGMFVGSHATCNI
jgi:hypothetical protein